MIFVARPWSTAGSILAAIVFGMMGTMAAVQTPANPQEPPPPEPHVPPPLTAPKVEALPDSPAPADDRLPERRDSLDTRDQSPAAAGASARVYVPHEPPPPVAERRSGDRPGPRAIWTSGYWEWDADPARFVWVAGSWRVPPAGMVWTPGRWTRDERGWYWVAGTWTPRGARTAVVANRPAWRVDGPPADQPDDTPPPAPGPDTFYIPGHYAPVAGGDRLAWVPGFWADIQPGWDWIPARWVRRPDGWEFRDGHWMRDPARVIVRRRPPRDPFNRYGPNWRVEVRAVDPIAGEEAAAAGDPVPVGAVATGMPYYMIRPPSDLYGPSGVVVPDTVPPFVRRMLDRVLP